MHHLIVKKRFPPAWSPARSWFTHLIPIQFQLFYLSSLCSLGPSWKKFQFFLTFSGDSGSHYKSLHPGEILNFFQRVFLEFFRRGGLSYTKMVIFVAVNWHSLPRNLVTNLVKISFVFSADSDTERTPCIWKQTSQYRSTIWRDRN